jgi:hypothetical protein
VGAVREGGSRDVQVDSEARKTKVMRMCRRLIVAPLAAAPAVCLLVCLSVCVAMTVGDAGVDVCSGVEQEVNGLNRAGLDVNFLVMVRQDSGGPILGRAHGYRARARVIIRTVRP